MRAPEEVDLVRHPMEPVVTEVDTKKENHPGNWIVHGKFEQPVVVPQPDKHGKSGLKQGIGN